MSRKANCYDNAPVESFFSSLKNELVRHRQFQNQADARYAIAEYIERFYNRQRFAPSAGLSQSGGVRTAGECLIHVSVIPDLVKKNQ